MRRATVFSHEELICKMASMPDALDLDLAKKLYDCMRGVVNDEISKREKVHEMVSILILICGLKLYVQNFGFCIHVSWFASV